MPRQQTSRPGRRARRHRQDVEHRTCSSRLTRPRSRCTHRSLQIPPPPFDPDRARPRAVVYVHLSDEALTAGTGIARVEDVGPVLLSRLRLLLGDRCTHQPETGDRPARRAHPVDAYEIPARLREQLQLRYPADVFPYAAAVSRSIDLDHTIPYLSPDQGGPPGQTRIGNLGPHVRRHHRQKTHGRLAGPTTRTRHLALAITPRPDLPGQRHRHPPPRRHHLRPDDLARRRPTAGARELKRLSSLDSLWLDVRSQSDSLITSVAA